MSEWREYNLSEISELEKRGWKVGDERAKYIALEHIEEGRLRLNGVGDSSQVSSNKFRFDEDSFLFGKLRPYFRKVVFPKIKGICSTDIWVVRAKENVDLRFLFYLYASESFIDLAYSGSSGTRMPRADWGFMESTLWSIPPLSEQRAIASVLGSLDDKIDLLHRQNKTLEALAETLFRKFFIDDAQDDWEEKRLGDVIQLFDSKRIPLSKTEREKMKTGPLYPYYGAAQIMDYINDYIFDGNYILLGEDGTVQTEQGYPVLQVASGKFWVNNHTHVLQAKKPYSNVFIWLYLKKYKINEAITGAVQPKINQSNLKRLPFPNYPSGEVLKFQALTEQYFCKIERNKKQIQTLEKLRDTLLPKLMSGEVRIAE